MPGVVFDRGDPFHADLLQAIYPAADRCGYQIVPGARVPARSERRAVEGLVAARCGALVLIGTETKQASWRRWAPGSRLPVAVLGRGCSLTWVTAGSGTSTAATPAPPSDAATTRAAMRRHGHPGRARITGRSAARRPPASWGATENKVGDQVTHTRQ